MLAVVNSARGEPRWHLQDIDDLRVHGPFSTSVSDLYNILPDSALADLCSEILPFFLTELTSALFCAEFYDRAEEGDVEVPHLDSPRAGGGGDRREGRGGIAISLVVFR